MPTNIPEFPGFSIRRLEHDQSHIDHVEIQFPRTGDRPPGRIIDKVALMSAPKEVCRSLQNAGADVPANRIRVLADALANLLPPNAGTLTGTTGWKDSKPTASFVMPNDIFGAADANIVLDDPARSECIAGEPSGTLKEWKNKVAAPALDSRFASAVILASLANPLLAFSDLAEPFILNLAGNSSSGKTTANHAAASVWGNPVGMADWNASPTAMAELASAHSDIGLVLDDAEKAERRPDERLKRVNEVTHLLTAGRTKQYARMVSGLGQLERLTFRCIVISSSPESIEAHAVRTGSYRTDGDRVRLLELLVPHGDDGGIWDLLPAKADTRNASNALRCAAGRYYGAAGRAWVEYLVEHQAGLRKRVEKLMGEFMDRAAPKASSVESRIAAKLGLLYAAGRIAITAKILPWSAKDIREAAQFAYENAIEASFAGERAERQALKRLKKALNNQKRFPRLRHDQLSDAQPCNGDGLIWRNHNRIYARLSAFQGIVAPCNHTSLLAKFLESGALLSGHSGGSTQDVRIGGEKAKYLVFDFKKLKKHLQAQS